MSMEVAPPSFSWGGGTKLSFLAAKLYQVNFFLSLSPVRYVSSPISALGARENEERFHLLLLKKQGILFHAFPPFYCWDCE